MLNAACAGRVVGVLFGLLVIVGIVGITVYCCKKRFNRYRWNRAIFRTPSKDPHQIPPDDQDQNAPLRTHHQDVKPVPMVGSSTGDAFYTSPQNDIYPSCAPPPYELACKSSGDLPYDPNPSIKKPQKTPNGFLSYSTAPLFNGPQYGNRSYSTGTPPNLSSNPTSYPTHLKHGLSTK